MKIANGLVLIKFRIVFSLLLISFFQLTFSNFLIAQERVEEIVGEDKIFSTPFCSATFGWTFPSGEMGKRYSSFMDLNANLGWKTDKNWVFMGEFGFAFGSDNVKIKDQILRNIMTTDNDPFVISKEGSDAGVVAYNRNLSFVLKAGKIIPISKKHPNSGIMLLAGGGWLQHQIIYQSTLEIAEQLEGDYAYGYDRQMRGFMLAGFIGYIHMSKKNFTNFYLGLEFNQAWTKMTREYQFDMRSGDNNIYQDRMWTVKLGWMFPFYGRDSDKVYYY
ncbi:MAG: hypothetical protein H6Q15_1300 [Bacteroidetes bacterium]|nr:hypothetical protein [Bacteroidota bacterium]